MQNSSTCSTCEKCEGIPVSTLCVEKYGDKFGFNSFNETIDYLVNFSKSLGKLEGVSTKGLGLIDNTPQSLFNYLVNSAKACSSTTTNTSTSIQTTSQESVKTYNCSADVSSLLACSNCTINLSDCEKLELVVSTLLTLKSDIKKIKDHLDLI